MALLERRRRGLACLPHLFRTNALIVSDSSSNGTTPACEPDACSFPQMHPPFHPWRELPKNERALLFFIAMHGEIDQTRGNGIPQQTFFLLCFDDTVKRML